MKRKQDNWNAKKQELCKRTMQDLFYWVVCVYLPNLTTIQKQVTQSGNHFDRDTD